MNEVGRWTLKWLVVPQAKTASMDIEMFGRRSLVIDRSYPQEGLELLVWRDRNRSILE